MAVKTNSIMTTDIDYWEVTNKYQLMTKEYWEMTNKY